LRHSRPYSVKFVRSDRTFTCAEDENVLEATASQLDEPYSGPLTHLSTPPTLLRYIS
jgi:hypothetical protein